MSWRDRDRDRSGRRRARDRPGRRSTFRQIERRLDAIDPSDPDPDREKEYREYRLAPLRAVRERYAVEAGLKDDPDPDVLDAARAPPPPGYERWHERYLASEWDREAATETLRSASDAAKRFIDGDDRDPEHG